MKLTPSEREECYALLGEGDTTFDGDVFSHDRKRWAADQVIAAFEQHVSETGREPYRVDIVSRVRRNLHDGRVFSANGEAAVGSIILTAILMAVIGWATRLLLDWLIEHWNKSKQQEH